jgi:uncharacterized protein YqjF (DUF2071 family)
VSAECFYCARFKGVYVLAVYVWTDAMVSDVPVCEDHAADFMAHAIDPDTHDFVGSTRVSAVQS